MERQYVGIDLHRRTSTIYRMNAEGETLGCVRIPSQPLELAEAMAEAGDNPEVVLESAYGWYWAADLLQELGANVHLAHPLGNNWGHRRVKNDERDAKDLAAMLRLGRLAEGWITPPETRELRELVRYRFRLVGHRSSCKAQVHGVMAKNGILPALGDMWGQGGTAQLDALELPKAYASASGLPTGPDRLLGQRDRHLRPLHPPPVEGRPRLQRHPEGRRHREDPRRHLRGRDRRRHPLPSPKQLCSWAGLTPKHRESDEKVRRGPITKQGSPLVRWAAIEAISKYRGERSSGPTTSASPSTPGDSRPAWRWPGSS